MFRRGLSRIASLGSFIFNPYRHLGVAIALPALFSHPRHRFEGAAEKMMQATETSRQALQAIWKAVRAIPRGQVSSYGTVAKRAGLPGNGSVRRHFASTICVGRIPRISGVIPPRFVA